MKKTNDESAITTTVPTIFNVSYGQLGYEHWLDSDEYRQSIEFVELREARFRHEKYSLFKKDFHCRLGEPKQRQSTQTR